MFLTAGVASTLGWRSPIEYRLMMAENEGKPLHRTLQQPEASASKRREPPQQRKCDKDQSEPNRKRHRGPEDKEKSSPSKMSQQNVNEQPSSAPVNPHLDIRNKLLQLDGNTVGGTLDNMKTLPNAGPVATGAAGRTFDNSNALARNIELTLALNLAQQRQRANVGHADLTAALSSASSFPSGILPALGINTQSWPLGISQHLLQGMQLPSGADLGGRLLPENRNQAQPTDVSRLWNATTGQSTRTPTSDDSNWESQLALAQQSINETQERLRSNANLTPYLLERMMQLQSAENIIAAQQNSVNPLLQSNIASSITSQSRATSSQPGTLNSSSLAVNKTSESASPRPQDSRMLLLYKPCDDERLSQYQCMVRKQIELFAATRVDVDSSAQGRNNPVVLGQVGIRCRHCADLHPHSRKRGAVYFPTRFDRVYQTAVNMAAIHLCKHCDNIPWEIREELVKLKDRKSSPGGGKEYWGNEVRAQGVCETDDGLRFES